MSDPIRYVKPSDETHRAIERMVESERVRELASLRRVLEAAEPLVPWMKKDYAYLKRLTRNQERMRHLVEEIARHRTDFPHE